MGGSNRHEPVISQMQYTAGIYNFKAFSLRRVDFLLAHLVTLCESDNPCVKYKVYKFDFRFRVFTWLLSIRILLNKVFRTIAKRYSKCIKADS